MHRRRLLGRVALLRFTWSTRYISYVSILRFSRKNRCFASSLPFLLHMREGPPSSFSGFRRSTEERTELAPDGRTDVDGGGELQQRRRPLLSPSLSLAQRTREPLLLGPPPPVLQAHPWGERRDGGGGEGGEKASVGERIRLWHRGSLEEEEEEEGGDCVYALGSLPPPPLLSSPCRCCQRPSSSFLPSSSVQPPKDRRKKKKERGVTTAGIFFLLPSSVSAADDDGPNPVISIPRQFQSALAVPKISLPPLSKKVAKKFRGHSTRNPLFRSGKKSQIS